MAQITILALITLKENHPSGVIDTTFTINNETKPSLSNPDIPGSFPPGVITTAQSQAFTNDKIKVGDNVTVTANGKPIGTGTVQYTPYGTTTINCNL